MESVLASGSKSSRRACSISDGLEAPVLGLRRHELDDVVLDRHDDRRRRLAGDDDRVVAGELHLRGERAAHVAVVEDAGGRALAADDEARRRADAGAGEGSGHEDDGTLGRPGVDLGRHLVPQVAQKQALAADVLLGPLHVERLDGGGARAQVDPEHFALVEVQCVLLKTCDRSRHRFPADRTRLQRVSRKRGSTGSSHSSRPGPAAATREMPANAGQNRSRKARPLGHCGAPGRRRREHPFAAGSLRHA